MPLAPPSSSGQGFQTLDGVVSAVHPSLFVANALGFAANQAQACRVCIPATGTLTDLAVFITGSAGNIDVGVYSTASPRVRLFSTGSIACPAAGAWTIVGALSLAVAVNDELDLLIANDTGTATIMGSTFGTAAVNTLPTGYLPALGASPRIAYFRNASFTLPATITDASISGAQSTAAAIIARVA